jgi:hypothetical protein
MDPLSALAIAAAVVQFVDFGIINVAAQFAILPYLEAKASSTNWRKALFQRGTRYTIGILESAIFGYEWYYTSRQLRSFATERKD